jgi:ribosome modulation factor
MKPISIISQSLFDKVRSRFSNLEMGDETGAVVIDPEEARFFDFDFVFEGNNLGRVSISINDPGSLKVYFSQGITENQDEPAKKEWFNFLREMRFFAMRRLLRFDTRDIAKTNLDKNDFQHLAKTQAPKEPDMTTMNENKKTKRHVTESDRPFRGVNGAFNRGDDERHDLDPSDWYKKVGTKMYTASIYPRQVAQAEREGWHRTKEQARANASPSPEGVAEDTNSAASATDPKKCHNLGWNAAKFGKSKHDCPYKPGTSSAKNWMAGWIKGKESGPLQQGVAEEGSENKYSNLSKRGVDRGINRAGDDFNRMLDLDQAESPHYKTQHQQDTKQRLKTKPMAGPKGVLPEQGVAEGLQEGRWNHKSSKKTSRAVAGRTEVIVRHHEDMSEMYPGARSQPKKIKAIFVQNRAGERWKCPFNDPALGFAIAQHVDHGGVPHDPAGQAIVQMSEEIAKLGEFHRKIRRASLHPDASGITERAMIRMNELKSQIAALGKKHHYQNWMETFNSDSMMNPSMEELDDVTMEQYKQKFTQTNFQEELTAYFPLLHRIMGETNNIDLADYVEEALVDDSNAATESFDISMGQASHGKSRPNEQFSEWADAVEQGILTPDQIAELKQAISELPQGENGPELKLGPAGTTAIEFFQGLGLDDNGLEEELKTMANEDAESDALEVFKSWCNKNEKKLAVALGIRDTDTGNEEPASADQQPAPEAPMEPEQPTAENDEMDMHKGAMPTKESVVKEVAKLVKSRYNKDNPEVGPFNGKENIALDVKKKCAEMFGEEVGEQAEGLAMQFMEKLSSEWEAKHGPVQDDGLARLKELLGNVKAKVEGIGDITDNGHAPRNNIMPAKEGILDKAKEFGKKILDKVAPGDDELLKRLEKDTGGKRPNMYNKSEQKEDAEFESIMKLAGISEGDGPKKISKKEVDNFQKKHDAKLTGREVNRQEQDKNKKK